MCIRDEPQRRGNEGGTVENLALGPLRKNARLCPSVDWPSARLGPRPDARKRENWRRNWLLCYSLLPLGWCPRPGHQPKGSVEQFEHVKMRENAVMGAHFLKSGASKKIFAATPPCLCMGARPAANAAVGKRGRLPKRMHKRAGTGKCEGNYLHRLQRCRWPNEAWP